MFGEYSDAEAYDYRKRKELQFGAIKRRLRAQDTAEKYSVRTKIGFVDMYVYRPAGQEKRPAVPATFFNFHGGGFVLRDWELDIPYCQKLADESGAVVVNVDYVTGPEYKFPLPQETTYEVLQYCTGHREKYGLPEGGFVVGGHSAGGSLSASLCELASAHGDVDIIGLVMDYPALRPALDPRPCPDPSRAIDPVRMRQYAAWTYEREDQLTNPLAAPLLAEGIAWPPTLINAASYDSLLDEARQFADKLASEGVDVDFKCYQGCMHGFTHANFEREFNKEASEDAWHRIAMFVRRVAGEE